MEELRSMKVQMFIFKTLSEMERQTKEAGKEPPGVLMEALTSQHHMLIRITGMDPRECMQKEIDSYITEKTQFIVDEEMEESGNIPRVGVRTTEGYACRD